MLPRQTVPASLAALLAVFRPLLTAPSYRTFCALACGLIAAGGRKTVCGMLTGGGLAGRWHHSRAHHLFAYARWSPDALGLALAGLLVARLVPAAAPIRLVVDDTLLHRRGRRVHAAYWTHDGSAADGSKIGYGNRWIICCLLVQLPFLTRPVALPVGFRLWGGKGATTPVVLAVELVQALADRFPDRRIDVVADGAYSPPARRALPARISWTLRLRRNARLDGLTPPRTGRPGRPRLRGDRLGTPTELAERATFIPVEVFRYGQRQQVHLAHLTCLWFEPFHTRPCRVVLLREQPSATGCTATGYDVALISTDLTSTPAALVARYAARWAIEVAIFDAKQTTGVGQARNRLRRAVERTAPFALLVQSLVVLWYVDHGQPAADVDAARLAAPWYTTKTEPCYADMHAALRKTIIAARFSPTRPAAPSDGEIHAVLAAWAAAQPAAAA